MGIDTPQLREPSLTGGKLSVSLYLLAFRLRAAALRSSHAPSYQPTKAAGVAYLALADFPRRVGDHVCPFLFSTSVRESLTLSQAAFKVTR